MLKEIGKTFMMMTYFDNWRKFLREAKDTSKVVKAVILDDDDNVLLLKNKQGWDLPGGHVKENESLSDALNREVKEETGLQTGDAERISIDNDKFTFYKIKVSSKEIKLSNEHDDHAFIELKKIDEYNISVLFKKAIKKA